MVRLFTLQRRLSCGAPLSQPVTTTLLGVILGICFGLTGSGGSTLAVPLLVYGLGLRPHHAVCVSMISVGVMAAVRSAQKLRQHEVEFRTAWVLAAAGLAGAPAGAWAGRLLPEKWLLSVFAIIVLVVALRMTTQSPDASAAASATEPRTAPPTIRVPSATIPTLCVTGFTTGLLAGLLGIGGGFVVVPALVLFCGLQIHRAIATSMFSIALISVAAMTAHWFAGQRPPADTLGLFTLGGMLGLVPGSLLAARVPGATLQRIFAVILLLLAVFIIIRSFGV